MDVFADFLAKIADPQHRVRTEDVLSWIGERFPSLAPRLAWNQPMFTDHGTFIIGVSTAKHHLAVAPEKAAIAHFARQLDAAGIAHTALLMRLPWERPVDYDLLAAMIEFNMADKADCATFWRKPDRPGAILRREQ
jgi:uncharacterized protein